MQGVPEGFGPKIFCGWFLAKGAMNEPMLEIIGAKSVFRKHPNGDYRV